jgi:hypothetical protein
MTVTPTTTVATMTPAIVYRDSGRRPREPMLAVVLFDPMLTL